MKRNDYGHWEYIEIEDTDDINEVIDEIQGLLTTLDNLAHDAKQRFGSKPNVDRHWTHLNRLVKSLSSQADNGDIYEFELVSIKKENNGS